MTTRRVAAAQVRRVREHIYGFPYRFGQGFSIEVDKEVSSDLLNPLITTDRKSSLSLLQDALLWNKLGAALANGGQSEKAVDAYYHALTLSPGFVRARYNLGISCFNLSAYKQAVEHFLTALKQQSDGIGPQGTHVQMSENIWRTLAIAIGHLQRPDLEQSIATRDLSKLLREFQVE